MRTRGKKEIAALKHRLDAAFKRGRVLSKSMVDDEIKADHTKYLCVLVSGFVEMVVPEIVYDYCHPKVHGKVMNYVARNLDRLSNLNHDKLMSFLQSFDQSWADEFNSFMEGGGRKDALNSVVGLRNRIAHGESIGQLSLSRLEGYYKEVQSIVEFLELLQ